MQVYFSTSKKQTVSRQALIFPVFFFVFLFTFNRINASDTTRWARTLKFKYFANAGVYFSNTTTNLRFDGNHVGVDFGLERDLGYNASGAGFRTEFIAQLSKRSSLMAYYFSLNKKKSWDLQRDITIRDTTFNPGANISSYFNIKNGGLDYRFSIFAKRTWQAGLIIGLKALYLEMGIDATTNRGARFDNTYHITLPTASIGLFGQGYLMPDLLLKYNIDYFEITISGFNGRVISQRLSLEYFFLKNFGAGASYNYITYKASDIPIGDNFKAQFLYTIYGVNVFASARF